MMRFSRYVALTEPNRELTRREWVGSEEGHGFPVVLPARLP